MENIDQLVQRIVNEIEQENGAAPVRQPAQKREPAAYPLADTSADLLKAKSGKPFREVTYEGLIAGTVTGDDLKTNAQTLKLQADIARQAGKTQFADNLVRASEMVSIPDEEVLRIYNLLRPNRTDKKTLLENARMLREQYQAVHTARLLEEAAEVYEKRGILK